MQLALELLRLVGGDSATEQSARVITQVSEVSDREFKWAVDGGLGPLLYLATRSDIARLPRSRRDTLVSADLTAQVLHAAILDSAVDVVDACAAVRVRATLLKGISVSSQYYPAGHLRPMSDIDVLVPADAYESVESELMLRGFARGSANKGSFSHHGIPLVHRQRRAWVELHTALYPMDSGLAGGGIFGLSNVVANSIPSTYFGRLVYRLTDELQLAYIASSWIRDLTLRKFHPSFLAPLFDLVYLLKAAGRTIDWDGLLEGLDNQLAAASVLVALSWLARHGLYSPPILRSLADRQELVGSLELGLTHAAIDRHLMGARRWRLPLPPPVPGRYNFRNQLNKRMRLKGTGWRPIM